MDLTEKDEKKLRSIERRILKCAKEIEDLNLKVYLNSAGLSLMDAKKHMVGLQDTALNENQVWVIPVSGWDGGDW